MATLLTGVGYIGATLLRRLADRGGARGPVVALDNFFSTSRAHVEATLPSGTALVVGDVANPADVARAFDGLGHEPAVVYHLAAQPSAAVARTDPEITERTNLVGARVLLEAAHERNARVVFGGSFRTYGDDLVGQVVSESTPYGRLGDLSHLSKIYVEQLARMIGVAFVSVRLGVTYGLSPIMKTAPAFMTVPNLFCWRAAHSQSLRVLEDRPVAFIHVRDAADALILSAERQLRLGLVWDSVNAASEVATIGEVARTVACQAVERGISASIDDVGSGGGAPHRDPSHSGGGSVDVLGPPTFSVQSVLDAAGFAPAHSLAGSLGEVLDVFVELARGTPGQRVLE